MNFLIENWALLSVALLSGGMLLWPAVRGGGMRGLDPNGAVALINRQKGQVVDVSEPEEFAVGHVTGARNVPLGQLEERLPQVVKNKALPVILVCSSGSRSQRALGVAKKLGYEQAQVLGGGMRAWKDANLPVERA
jgi:rhodanese-related sulfurtransferase